MGLFLLCVEVTSLHSLAGVVGGCGELRATTSLTHGWNYIGGSSGPGGTTCDSLSCEEGWF